MDNPQQLAALLRARQALSGMGQISDADRQFLQGVAGQQPQMTPEQMQAMTMQRMQQMQGQGAMTDAERAQLMQMYGR